MKKQTIFSALFLTIIMAVMLYVTIQQCNRPSLPPDDKPKVISDTFEIKPEDFAIADGGGCEVYKGNLTFWQSVEGINGAALYVYPDGYEYGVLTLNLQIRRDDPESAGGLEVKTDNWYRNFGFGEYADKTPFMVVSDTVDFTNTSDLSVSYKGAAGCNVDVISGKLQLFKTVTNFGE